MAHIAPFAGTDGIAAMRIVAKHAAEFGIDKNRIGFMGFSAGGRVTISVAFYHDAATRPEFLAPVYAGLGH